jgi:hypothetical protein
MPQQNRTALITGASSGIGAEYARQLAARGYDLILVARREERLRALAAELEKTHNVQAEILVADLVQDDDVQRVEAYIQSHEHLEILVNNAGFNALGAFTKANFPRMLDMMTLHMHTSVRLTRAALPAMLERKKGVIIMVSSLNSLSPMAFTAAYGASKAFLNHFTEALALELKGRGVVVQVLAPGFTRTEITHSDDFKNAGFSEESLPDWMWLEAEYVVKTSLARLGRGRVVVVPGLMYRFAAVIISMQHLPPFRALANLIGSTMTRNM